MRANWQFQLDKTDQLWQGISQKENVFAPLGDDLIN